MHAITPNSPLYQETAESLAKKKAQLIISLSGIDETVAHTIHARHTYAVQDIIWNARLVDIFYDTRDGHRYLDFSHFHDVELLSSLD
jgi:inward rectifier potassium channel